ncbi:MAG: monofunctional biosynthetic peptidoglycan transglycosylase [Halobacteria archaeon]|nr:monofunctional biosynthetic peptidoglycan transglycosylase [Halobacteria archaeon]
MVKSRNRLGGWRFRRHVTTALVIVILVSIALTLPWRWLAPPTTAFMLQERFHHKGSIHQRWVPWSEISPALPVAIVAAEDQKFPHHYGFDFQSISEALQEDRQRRRGASTITQQLAKNLYLWPGRSLLRKALEAYFTVLIEFTWPKRRVLEVYLNVVEFGPKIYGVDAASRLFFGKPPSRITSQEAAILAAVLPSPKRMSALHPSDYVRKRSSEIEAAVIALGGPDYLARL